MIRHHHFGTVLRAGLVMAAIAAGGMIGSALGTNGGMIGAIVSSAAGATNPAACERVAEAPTDGNIAACYGLEKSAVLAITFGTGSPGIAPADWSNGWEHGYMVLCEVTDAERATWATPYDPTVGDIGIFLTGYNAALDSEAQYETAGFDPVEWCADNHP